jgi:hypothetical protein
MYSWRQSLRSRMSLAACVVGFGAICQKKCAKSAKSAIRVLLFGHQLLCIGLRCLVFFLPRPGGGRPEGGGAASGGFAVADDCVDHHQLFEGGIDTVAVNVAMEKTPDLIFGQSFGGCLESLANTVGNRVTGGIAEEKGSAGGAVIPYGKGSLEMPLWASVRWRLWASSRWVM